MKLLLLLTLISIQVFGYVDMSDTVNRANDLGMTSQDYAFAMAIAGTFSGSILGLFLWKAK